METEQKLIALPILPTGSPNLFILQSVISKACRMHVATGGEGARSGRAASLPPPLTRHCGVAASGLGALIRASWMSCSDEAEQNQSMIHSTAPLTSLGARYVWTVTTFPSLAGLDHPQQVPPMAGHCLSGLGPEIGVPTTREWAQLTMCGNPAKPVTCSSAAARCSGERPARSFQNSTCHARTLC